MTEEEYDKVLDWFIWMAKYYKSDKNRGDIEDKYVLEILELYDETLG